LIEIAEKLKENFQGGYDGANFLANVEVYDQSKDAWEDGVPLTSGRSGLASAVIYQPSCPGSYTQDCFSNPTDREFDDSRQPPDGHDDNVDLNSQGPSSSYHLNCSSNFFNGCSENSQFDDVEFNHCKEMEKKISGELFRTLRGVKLKLNEDREISNLPLQTLQQQLNEMQIVKLAKFHMNCRKHSSCPLQSLKRRFRHFIFKNKDKHLRKS
jgi:hypothetical protein